VQLYDEAVVRMCSDDHGTMGPLPGITNFQLLTITLLRLCEVWSGGIFRT
jgi:hypothetical protein